jgi:hypothetical protein
MSADIVYVDSAEEQRAYLVSRFGPETDWSVLDQRLVSEGVQAAERSRFQTTSGVEEVEFREARRISLRDDNSSDENRGIDQIMQRSVELSADNPPHHPGSLPRFPIPIEHYQTAVGIPLPILAVDDLGVRGLYAPPRMAVVDWSTSEPVGVRDFPGFDEGQWPPRRLGDWPAPTVLEIGTEQLQASITRFEACWARLIDVWFARTDSILPEAVAVDARAALTLRALLDIPAMDAIYERLNQRFAMWLTESASV